MSAVTEKPQTPEEAKRLIREIFRQMGATFRAAPKLNRIAVSLLGAAILLWIFVGLLIALGG